MDNNVLSMDFTSHKLLGDDDMFRSYTDDLLDYLFTGNLERDQDEVE
jgi:hypothetical protein